MTASQSHDPWKVTKSSFPGISSPFRNEVFTRATRQTFSPTVCLNRNCPKRGTEYPNGEMECDWCGGSNVPTEPSLQKALLDDFIVTIPHAAHERHWEDEDAPSSFWQRFPLLTYHLAALALFATTAGILFLVAKFGG